MFWPIFVTSLSPTLKDSGTQSTAPSEYRHWRSAAWLACPLAGGLIRSKHDSYPVIGVSWLHLTDMLWMFYNPLSMDSLSCISLLQTIIWLFARSIRRYHPLHAALNECIYPTKVISSHATWLLKLNSFLNSHQRKGDVCPLTFLELNAR